MNMSGPRIYISKRYSAVLAAALLLAAGSAHAALGGNFASVQAEAQRINGTLRTVAMPSYDVHEIQVNGHTVERQYMSHAGQVFGISWKSTDTANLQTMLGSYFTTYQSGTVRRIDLHHSALTTPGLVVQVGSFIKTFMVRAYIPGNIPAGIDASEIR
jgi:hypothetical protein